MSIAGGGQDPWQIYYNAFALLETPRKTFLQHYVTMINDVFFYFSSEFSYLLLALLSQVYQTKLLKALPANNVNRRKCCSVCELMRTT